jgi:hypothetical protein
MTTKACFKCGEAKPLSEFYRHPAMADGHLGKCKPCAKSDARLRRAEKLDEIRAYDRERGLLPHRKAGVRARADRYKDQALARTAAYRAAHPERRHAHSLVNAAVRDGKLKVLPCERCGDAVGVQGHHEDYNKPLEVIWLCPFHHGERHREINEERRKMVA